MNRLAPLMAEALAARTTRDTETAEAAAAEALARKQHDEAEYEVRARVMQDSAAEILGDHADGIRWVRWYETPRPIGMHPDLPPRLAFTDAGPQPGYEKAPRRIALTILPGVRADGGPVPTDITAWELFTDLPSLADAVDKLEKELAG